MTGRYISEMSYKRLKDKPEYNREKLWLIKDLIPQGEVVMIYGDKGVGKTFMTLDIALQIATGSQELGHTKRGIVTYIPLRRKEWVFPESRSSLTSQVPRRRWRKLTD